MQQQEMNASVALGTPLDLTKLFPKELFSTYAIHSILTNTAVGRSLATIYLSSLQQPGYCIVWVFHVVDNHLHNSECDAFCTGGRCDSVDGVRLASIHVLKPPDAKIPVHEVFPDIVPPPAWLQFQ